ncbi:hypothetical protein AURDEDRAFT_165137 [Auricularia subglabra TFB-10046 SS5]|nr:hypothetical protein AURDEDRAFT_165137 [Auricularia subglabra TFB-10046 SS5]
MSFNSIPTTPVKKLLEDYIPDAKDPNMLHCRVPNHVVTRGGPDSVFTWINALGGDRIVWRPVDSPYATLSHCLDIRRDGDEGGEFFQHDEMAEMFGVMHPPEPAAKNVVDWSLSGPQQPQQHPYGQPIAPFQFQLPLPSGANSPNSLFSEPDNARDFSPPSSPKPAPQIAVGPASAALPPPLALPGGNGTIAPRDIFSPLAFPQLPLQPATPPYFPSLPPHPLDERRKRRARDKRKMQWDDSDFEMSDDDASGDDDSDFAGPSTSRGGGGGRTRKTSSTAGSPRGEPKSPLPCKFPGCDFVQRNGRQVDLSRHEQTHYPARPKHECPDCGHQVSRKDALRRHQEQSCRKSNGAGVKRTGRKKTRKSYN